MREQFPSRVEQMSPTEQSVAPPTIETQQAVISAPTGEQRGLVGQDADMVVLKPAHRLRCAHNAASVR